MLIEAAHLQPQVPPALALRRLQVAQQQLQERGLAHAVRTCHELEFKVQASDNFH